MDIYGDGGLGSVRTRATNLLTMRRSAIYTAILASGIMAISPAQAQADALGNYVGDLIVSSSMYTDPGFAVGAGLPISTGATATAASTFCATANCSVNVWNNASADANFGITSGITMQDVNATTGSIDNSLNVTALAAAQGTNLATSFSSKSELAVNLSADGQSITFMGYNTGSGQLDISNSNTPGIIEPGNTDTATPTYRAVAQINLSNNALQVTDTNAYAGNNGRAAILASNGQYYTVGNAGNGSGSALVTGATGVQLITPGSTPGAPGTANVGAYSITQNGYAADKTPKDSNYRGMTVFNNTLYVTKGSGSNGIDTVYQVGTAGSLPAAGNSTPVSILPGFNTTLAKTNAATPHPFGIWFANASTLYVADEGSGASTDFGTSPTTQAGGLQKYSLVNGSWVQEYTLKGSLIGSSYTVNGTGSFAGDSLTTTTDGLRNLTGRVNADGTVTLFALTSTEGSVLGDAGADPNRLVSITDNLSFASATQASGEDYSVLQTAALGQVLRGVTIAAAVPEASEWLMMLSGLGLIGFITTRRKNHTTNMLIAA